ncbi:MAG TPA: DUF4097 family beta strand repeat-containing protein [Pyrinomonadaceae bacterium]|nr:DUF4097 family beta strand repeat-containing protein [Pyrinomonadaceae bacterium]
MNIRCPAALDKRMWSRVVLTLIAISILSLSHIDSFAQRSFSRKYPVRRDVRLELRNLLGTITVIAWDREEIKVSANMDTPVARFTPEQTTDGLVIDVVRDNRGRGEVGDVNFQIYVPVNSAVDLVTKRGNIRVSGVRGELVRAHVSSEGDIDLTGISAVTVMASNTIGNILFDGELAAGGKYEFRSWQGDINIRIPADSAFRLNASAPQSRHIALGMFGVPGLSFIGEGRKVVGNVGDGRALLTVTNYRGKISFIRR